MADAGVGSRDEDAAERLVFRPAETLVLGVVGALSIGIAAMSGAGERFSDVASIFTTDLIKEPASFTRAEHEMLSGRAYLWSEYIYAYDDAKPFQKLIGLGPDSWDVRFKMYAHNTLVSYLYEIGIVGVIAILALWGTMFALAPSSRMLVQL